MSALPFLIGAICIFVIMYRFYSAFISARILTIDPSRTVPAVRFSDGKDYVPTNKWVVFGHHFAAIAGAGPLIGPVLAAQFGFLPGLLWMVIGAVIGGAVHDMTILALSVRRDGKSLAEIARHELSPFSSIIVSIAILFIIIIALAGLGLGVVNALHDSPWGTFTIAMTIPLAIFVGLWMNKIRKGQIAEASIIGVIGVLASVIFGSEIPNSWLAPYFTFSKTGITNLMAAYGFIASVLPVWLLLAPRDYLSSYMKIGTIGLLIIGVFVVMPELKMPMVTEYIHGGGPIIPGKVFPFVFITIACGAISGFHSLIASGTTPKMLSNEREIPMVGYGAMLVESLVSVVALIAAASLHPADYFAINVASEKFASLNMVPVNLDELSREVGEIVAGRPGGAVSLAVGFAQIFSAIPGMKGLMSYWYHFAIMFEALFILTTIDAGTRVGRFIVQEFLGRFYKPFSRTDWLPGSLVATTIIVTAWAYFIHAGSISTIWPMFGVANQLLAAVALAIATTAIINAGKVKYVWVTAVPLAFISVITLTAGYLNIVENFLPLINSPTTMTQGYINIVCTAIIMFCVVAILADSFRRWYRVLVRKIYTIGGEAVIMKDRSISPPEYGCC